jgi:hypothetical protein
VFGLFYVVFWIASSVVALPPRNDGWRGIAALRLQWQREMLLQKYQLINTVTNSVIARHEVPRQSKTINEKK